MIMASLVGLIQHIAQQVIQASKLCDVCYGTVKKANPLEIELEQTMLDLPTECLVQTSAVKGQLGKDDKVVMIRAAGGQQFVVLSKV